MFKWLHRRRNKLNIREKADLKLLRQIYQARDAWQVKQQKQNAMTDPDKATLFNTRLAKAKFNYLYHQARLRHINGAKIIDAMRYAKK
ncbi:MAG: YaaL family protein [Candidatus Paralactobacillus gallistercoris]|uniref:YaaL family protein n=1 Tax=Candidatus Paralactobacillus gallistercoris TaxID=2838724 RepID=A0A948TJX7_9LACO|nr:YaaL family protein [Candidatus Paralactobacillus gallistercoris]